MSLNQKSLEALRAFVETGSVNGAAERLFRTAPQISRLLSALEEQVGFTVLSRRGRRLRLTRKGKEFYQDVERLLSSHDDLERRADQIRQGQKEHIRILTAPFVSHAVINKSLASVMKRYPNMTAQIDARVRLDIDIWMTQETFDLGIAPLPIKDDVFEVEPFLELPMIVAMHPDHALAHKKVIDFDDFIQHEIIATHTQSLLGQHLEALCKTRGKRLKIKIEARNGVIACQMAALNLGICLADPFVALSSGVDNLILRPFEPLGTLKYAFFYPAWGNRIDIVDEVATEIRETTSRLAKHIFEDMLGAGPKLVLPD
ncbi:MAG: LysR family transcriptional regulator [Methylocystaceae bacterium]|nr:LysR family transcriptional regulator [Methylocystaceae bacterium]